MSRAVASTAEVAAAGPRVILRGTPEQQARIAQLAAAAYAEQSVVVLPWIGRPHGLPPVAAAWQHRLRGERVRWIDLDGVHGACGIGFLLVQTLRLLLFVGLDALARGLAAAIRTVFTPGTADAAAMQARAASGPITLVLPILPDLSHTFVYREALRIRELHPDTQVLVLARGDAAAPTHAEARALLEHAQYLPPRGVLARHCAILRWLVAHPRRAAGLLRAYATDRSRPGEAEGLFGKLPLRDPRHPGRAFELASWLAKRAPRGPIHVFGSTYAANVTMGACALTARNYGITSYVDFDFEYDFRMLEAKVRSADFFRVCTTYCQARMRDLVPAAVRDRTPVILFGLDLSAWTARTERPPRAGVMVSASRLVPKKGLHLVPPALASLHRTGVKFRWIVAGDGPERGRLEALVAEHGIGEHVEFLGAITAEAVSEQLRGADLALLPCVIADDGERDGIPIFLTEAMALGVPVLTTPVSGIPELVRDGVSGVLVAPDDVDQLAARLHTLLDDHALLDRLGQGGLEAVRTQLDLDTSVRALVARIRGTGAEAGATR